MFLDMFYMVLADCVQSTHGMPILGGLGARPPQKIGPSEIEFESIFDYLLTLIQPKVKSIALKTLLAKKALWH